MKLKSIAVSAIVAGLLIGCGGGSSSDNDNITSDVSGAAVDDIIQNGIVELRADSLDGKILTTTRTDNNGNYSAKVSYKGVIVTTIKCDKNSTFLKNDGTIEKCDLTQPLMSIASISEGDNSVNVSPVTSMLVSLVTQGNDSKTITTDDITKAKKTIAYMYGIDPVISNPIEDTTYKKQISALHIVAQENNISMNTLMQQLNTDAEDGIIGDNNKTIITSLKTVLKNEGIQSSFINSDTIVINSKEIADSNISYDKIALAKNTFDIIRGQLDEIANKNEAGSLDKESQLIQESLDKNSIDIIGYNTDVISKLLNVIVNKNENLSGTFILNNDTNTKIDYTLKTDDNKTWEYTLNSDNNTYTGEIKTNIDSRVEYTPSTLPNNITATIDGTIPSKDNMAVNVKADMSLTHDDSNLELNINNLYLGTNNNNINIKNVNLTASWYKYLDDNGEEDADLHWFKLNNITLDTTLDNRFNFSGTIKIDYIKNEYVAQKADNNSNIDTLGKVKMELNCISADGEYLGNYDGDETPTFTIVTTEGNKTFTLNKTQWNGMFEFNTDNSLEIVLPQDFKDTDIIFNYNNLKCSEGNVNLGYTSVYTSNELVNSGYIPNTIEFKGTVKDIQTNVSLDGTITAKADNFLNYDFTKDTQPIGEITLNVLLTRPNFANTILNTTYKSLNIDGDEDISLSYQEGDKDLITMTASYDKVQTKLNSGKVTITSINGFKLSFNVDDHGDIKYGVPVYVDDTQVGTLEERDGAPIVKYSDGTIESIN